MFQIVIIFFNPCLENAQVSILGQSRHAKKSPLDAHDA